MNKSKVFLLFLLPLLAFSVHKYYISLIKVDFKPQNESVQITMRIFIDDLQEVLNKTNNISIELGVKDESKEYNSLISKYIKDNFKIKIDSKLYPFQYLGKEYENDIVYIYLELSSIKSIHSIEISDTMLMKYFPSQKNIIKLNINDVKKTFFLTEEAPKDILNF
ncbi:peptidase E [Aureibaculum sp. A20]|uniref:Peptidase E n=1 Tax=Aureibaculum flavum TaxID=2795986 RepID=A0ABS0WKY5_9FLAO|nr:DUF6702 family protein [Aureibaculum flavum]MBJ2172637.1 peptidase E [Aureibaculum flavum]